ncbi:3'-5' exonuclease [Altibacter sp. HG106]|uniref:3'-5' exonuclease n=1 Tax=Altibacter sp. HG106 TaxID=3023937 RepID=UPI002350E0DB|nr:3'-5' exonuclease [Altibacter sp. HG106]MDC7995057.1 3'-5' exonuclease [Altibacter sp. HG106]
MLTKVNPEHLLFLDIETVPQQQHFSDLSPLEQDLWEVKTQYQRKDEISAADFYERAGIWAEFGKIVCISAGFFAPQGSGKQFRVTSFHGTEKDLLTAFKNKLEGHFNRPHHLLVAHNGKEFDFPYIARRMIIHGISLPQKLNLFGKKPWEVPHLDTMELWKFGDYKTFTSLKLLAHVLGVPSPKEDIDGSQVRDVYYQNNDLDRIIEYCERDVVTVAQLFLRFRNEALLEDHQILSV